MLVFLGRIFGFIVPGVFFVPAALLVLMVLIIAAFRVAARLFQREIMLTRWK